MAVLHVVIVSVRAIFGPVGLGRFLLRLGEALLAVVLVGGPCGSAALLALSGGQSRHAA